MNSVIFNEYKSPVHNSTILTMRSKEKKMLLISKGKENKILEKFYITVWDWELLGKNYRFFFFFLHQNFVQTTGLHCETLLQVMDSFSFFLENLEQAWH